MIGVMLLLASGQGVKARWLVLVVIWAEVFRGVVCDSIWILRGYDYLSYLVFIIIHLLIIVTGFMFLKSAKSVFPTNK